MSNASVTISPTVEAPILYEHSTVGIPRSASYPHLPPVQIIKQAPPSRPDGIRRTFSDTILTNLENGIRRQPFSASDSNAILGGAEINGVIRRKSARLGHNSKITVSRFAVTEQSEKDLSANPPKSSNRKRKPGREATTRSVSSSLSTLARKSWINSSRSTSPSPTREGFKNGRISEEIPPVPILLRDVEVLKKVSGKAIDEGTSARRRNTLTGKKPKRPLSAILGKTIPLLDSDNPMIPSIPKSFSTDRLPSYTQNQSSSEKLPIVPRSKSSERLQSHGLDIPRKKDELWSNFRTLDGEYQKFLSKPSTSKANVIRTVLLPFLRTYHEHQSNKTLRAEDLDRRVNILNKWWTGLLEMLNGRNGQSVSGNDRPTVLEGVTGIMLRPEWKISTLSISSRPDRFRPSLKSRSTTSLESTASEFLAESVLHNVRNTFIQNLLSQMAFVVDKMSMRNVPASVVTFCGKATAYAFFFCPVVAEILVRLWTVPSEAVRRVLNEVDVSRNTNMGHVADKVSTRFPTHLRILALRSLPSLIRYLRRPPQIPLSSAYIPWYGPWVGRWAGRDSDLLFVFFKHFHILSCEYIGDGATKVERICAPCCALVQAQLLTILDGTIHRSASQPYIEAPSGPQPITFDDVLGANASAAALPLPAPNLIRAMAENRIILLLREFLLDTSNNLDLARRTFAESFGDLLKAAARRTSLFDHTTCFTLCDFLEEAIDILARYYNNSDDPASFLDWSFWLEVCKQMMNSHNSMTEVRLYAFLYSLWAFITTDDMRKQDVCLNWILSEDHFQQQFNHWCPMVRAYYMRLLCWRIARLDGEESALNLAILTTLYDRLKTNWCHLLHLQDDFERQGLALLSTTPCHPAPGRRLLIIRNDIHPAPGGVYLSFDGILAGSSAAQPTAYERHHSLSTLSLDTISSKGRDKVRSSSPGKKRWDLLKSLIPFIAPSSNPLKTTTPTNPLDAGSTPRSSTDHDRLSTSSADNHSKSEPPHTNRTLPTNHRLQHQIHSFKFSLEWLERPIAGMKERRLQPPRLPHFTQAFIESKHGKAEEAVALRPSGTAISSSKYSGRALAEWALVIIECQNFFERRKHEGAPGYKFVETPTLGVEAFRKPG